MVLDVSFSDGLYRALALALYPGAFWPVSVALVARALGAREGGRGGKRFVGELKLLDPHSSNPDSVLLRGGYVAFGNTRPGIEAQVFGLAERGEPGKAFDPTTGQGHVAQRNGDYTFALSKDCDVQCLLFETFGGFSASVTRLLGRAARDVQNKLSNTQYLDEARDQRDALYDRQSALPHPRRS